MLQRKWRGCKCDVASDERVDGDGFHGKRGCGDWIVVRSEVRHGAFGLNCLVEMGGLSSLDVVKQ